MHVGVGRHTCSDFTLPSSPMFVRGVPMGWGGRPERLPLLWEHVPRPRWGGGGLGLLHLPTLPVSFLSVLAGRSERALGCPGSCSGPDTEHSGKKQSFMLSSYFLYQPCCSSLCLTEHVCSVPPVIPHLTLVTSLHQTSQTWKPF